VGEFVVIAMVALEAVIAGKITLERREHGHAQLLCALAQVGEILPKIGPLTLAALDDEAVFDERVKSVTLFVIHRAFAAGYPVKQTCDIL
jgi:hypothetical protein